MEKSDPFHVQKGIGAALLVAVGSPLSLEAHMLVEADGLRVLLVDRQFLQVVMANAVFQKLPSQPCSRSAGERNSISRRWPSSPIKATG